jgi:hypothetical protein
MPTIADLYNLIVQATNAVIHAIHGVGLMIFILGLVHMTKELANLATLLTFTAMQARWKIYYVVAGLCYIAGIVLFITVVL